MSVIITNTSGSSAAGVGTYVTGFTGVAAWPTANGGANNFEDLVSISVPIGTWSIGAQFYSDNSAVITTTDVTIGITSTAGNSGTGLVNGDTAASFNPLSLVAGAARNETIVGRIYVNASTTTYYLKIYAGGSIANLRAAGRLTAIRIA